MDTIIAWFASRCRVDRRLHRHRSADRHLLRQNHHRHRLNGHDR
jgi:hypothetical protein